ncbi:MAG: hypothetical protein KGH63_04125, partial [Candidatus Micrarchaeota archaeon]|nr:hypothetical protein [Candidatus Micrarchaeota archaeon]
MELLHPAGHVERPTLSSQLRAACSGFPKAYALAQRLLDHEEYRAACEAANALAVNRLGYSDHGKTHALICAVGAMQIYKRGLELGWPPSFGGITRNMEERSGGNPDSASVVVLGALMHDVGNSIARLGHQQWGLTVAKPILDDVLSGAYKSADAREKMTVNVLETILTHDESVYASAMEASCVKIADGMDCESGRSRLPWRAFNADNRYGKSAMSIYYMHLGPDTPDRKLPIWAEMGDAAGLFQMEAVLCKKIRSSMLDGRVVVEAFVGG